MGGLPSALTLVNKSMPDLIMSSHDDVPACLPTVGFFRSHLGACCLSFPFCSVCVMLFWANERRAFASTCLCDMERIDFE